MLENVNERLQEFKDFVWNHAEDAFQAKFDTCADFDEADIEILLKILDTELFEDISKLATTIRTAIKKDPRVLRQLLQIVGLTRNKIIQDIKAYARANKVNVSLSSPERLFNTVKGATLGSEYLARQVVRVFGGAYHINEDMLQAINQATWPGYIRQERAKRMGHEAEYRLACVLRDINLPFEPLMKAENPLCPDILIDGMSYDLISPSESKPLMRVVSTVHTANIGQYGESKDDLEIRKALKAIGSDSRVTLLAFIDGVGFESNRAGLQGVLSNAHEFCQFRTIWKAAAIAARKSRLDIEIALPEIQIDRFQKFAKRHKAQMVDSEPLGDNPDGWIPAGDAFIRML